MPVAAYRGPLRGPLLFPGGNLADRVAVFVDAGYLFAQGSTALTGSKRSRSLLTLNHEAVVRALIEAAASLTRNQSLLRIYWYDGVLLHSSGQTGDHAILAHTDNVKIRLGSINSQGQQKGVDSLIVTDMIDLARNGTSTSSGNFFRCGRPRRLRGRFRPRPRPN